MADSELYAVADFCLIPMGTAEPSVAIYIAECQRVLEKSGLKYKARRRALLTLLTIELRAPQKAPGTPSPAAIHACHAAVHAQGAPRIATDIRIGTRVDRAVPEGTGNEGKVRRVEEILAKDAEAGAA